MVSVEEGDDGEGGSKGGVRSDNGGVIEEGAERGGGDCDAA